MKNEWAEILKKARENQGMSLRDLESQCGVSNAYLSQLENGKFSNPSFFKMLRIIAVLGVSVKDIEPKKNWKIKAGRALLGDFSEAKKGGITLK
jgi:transcriptional regulator with XRE-family HTH domain